MALQITGNPPAGKVGASYEFTPVAADGGTSLPIPHQGASLASVAASPSYVPPSFSLSVALPAGMLFDVRSGTIYGTPKAAGVTSGMVLKAHRELWNGNQYVGPEDSSITFDLTITN